MPENPMPPNGAPRPAYYVTAVDALLYARYFHAFAGQRGYSRIIMQENLPGWTLSDFMFLMQRHRLFATDADKRRTWRTPDVVGVVIEGDTVIRDRGNLEHPAKTQARRGYGIGLTSTHVRHLWGDDSPIVVHVRLSAATPDEVHLHEVVREAYLAAAVRPSLLLNVSGFLADPFDQPDMIDSPHLPPQFWWLRDYLWRYNSDVASLLQAMRTRHTRIVLLTLSVHDGGEPIEVFRADRLQLPPPLRSDTKGIVSRVVSLRADTLLEPRRADTVAALVGLVGGSRSVNQWARGGRTPLLHAARPGHDLKRQ